jgi:hypothetical protein
MRSSTLQLTTELAKEGVILGWHFGSRSIAGLVRIAEYIQRSVYLEGSLRRTASGFRFILLNPPLRLGAFTSVELLLDAVPIPGSDVSLRSESMASPRTASSVTRETPVHWLPGMPVEVSVRVAPAPGEGVHSIRLNLRNAAIPPRVWFEFRDRISGKAPR